MALIGNIRKHSGLIIIVIGVALAAFVLGDFFKPRSGPKTTDIGEIDGENVTYRDFSYRVDEEVEMLKQRQETEILTPDEVFQAKESVWNKIVREIVMGKEYEELGLTVTSEELFDQVQGPRPHQYILQYFKDPETGQYNPSLVLNFLKTLDQREPEAKEQWLMLEKAIKEDRLNTKFNNLISKGYYLPNAFAKKEYENQNSKANINFVNANYQTVPDSSIILTEEDFEKYYEDHKNEYKQEASCDIDYVIFEVNPSKEDRQKIEEEVKEIYAEFIKIEDNYDNFINATSDTRYDSTFHKKGTLPVRIDSIMFNSPVGTIVPPYIEEDAWHMAKLLDVQYRPDSMRMSFILITHNETNVSQGITRTREEAELLADSLLQVLNKEPQKFEEFVQTFSDDPSTQEKNGDIGWFADQSILGNFNQFCLEGKIGDMGIEETNFGFHIIKITDKMEDVKKVKVAMINRLIEPSSTTFQDIYATANKFASENNTLELFENSGMNIRKAENVKRMDNSIPGIKYPRIIIQWAFLETTIRGSVSQVYDIDNSFVVAMLLNKREKGIASLDQVKASIEPLVMREKKAEVILQKINNANPASLQQVAQMFNSTIDTAEISFYAYNLLNYGPEPQVIGASLELKQGEISKPIKGNSGIFVVRVNQFIPAPETQNYYGIKMQMSNAFLTRVRYELFTALMENANIVDNRGLFY
jgi:peptidyl-prolyl cis-trans isomerase D